MKSKSVEFCNPDVLRLATELGERIRVARVRRKLRQSDLAEMAGISRSTLQSIERGDVRVSVAALFGVLWTLGLAREISLIADPGLDRDGLSLAMNADTKRVYLPKKLNNDF